tara:strand:- start:25 stop:543 length:519 start_codon:yes stop_codon:yes gene_type:complete
MSTIKVNSIVPVSGVPTGGGGGIVQIKSTTKTDTFSTANHSFTDITGLSVSITPTSTSSKIFIIAFVTGLGTSNTRANFKLLRGSTEICQGDAAGSRPRCFGGIYTDDAETPETVSVNFLDSPSTTSATTYKIQISSGNSVDAVYVNRANGDTDSAAHARTASTITVMEVSA